MKLPIKRKPIAGSKDLQLVDAAGESLARVHGSMVAYPEEAARTVLRSVNNQERLLQDLERAEAQLARYRMTPKGLKAIDLSPLTRYSKALFTVVQLEDPSFQDVLTTMKGETKQFNSWLTFGAGSIHNEGRTCFIGSRMRDGITDFEHDSCYAVHLELIGLTYKWTDNHTSYFEAHITPNPDGIRIHEPDFVPEDVKGAWRCKDKDCDKHLMLPDGNYTPPMYKFARVVAGQRVSIRMGTDWDAIDKPKRRGTR